MIDFLKTVIDYIGTGNALTIVIFLIGLLFAYYFYYRTFYRLVYSSERICLSCKELGDLLKNEDHSFKTRILFYNNGRKTLTKEENKQLDIISSKSGIKSAKVLENKEVDLIISEKKININFENLDSKKFFIIEIDHSDYLYVEGRISEIGKILHTEPKKWVVINILFLIIFFGVMFSTLFNFIDTENLKENLPIALNFILIILLAVLMRFIHSLFFIPDSLTAKYLQPKNKLQNEFMNEI
ncbi:hypothetical protein [Tenacibaculum finnmarkense]|uniref:hypothetical protein n=1 Tax=Tenacibaculum finnmarkense TaxID=2781243 RepID=UPI001E365ACB|nr:hypothetical protein [Tenacibaculum finnmarkense]MCD8423652.1 hypothetical protein [Tenacibaculum finnmarkense genomovar ulcerans]MCG8239804.1 hypothetical protein [Tenacibaculum finnmarkense genomovar ulcerans]MCG8796697.1 hypothetical protein [Tenacibaculum finnmarkense]MCG8799026.1 hypothetical protein [Tenacibaculum finnmarkense]